MKIQTFKDKLKAIESYGVQAFIDKEYIGSCPCFSGRKKIDGYTLAVWGRCWRVSENVQDLYIASDMPKKELREIGKMLKERLDKQEWYSPYTLKYKPLSYFDDNIK